MIYLETGKLYYNARLYFRQHILESLPHNDADWALAYKNWLQEQGCVIVKNEDDRLIVDILGVAPGYDKFGFSNEEDAMLFTLRWS